LIFDFGFRIEAEIAPLLRSGHSDVGTRAPGQAAVFCSVSPAVVLADAGSSFTCAEHGSLS
jgi:hypothetical protein